MSADKKDNNNQEFEGLLQRIEHEGQNVFVTGRAGTGKSTFLMYLRQRTKKNYVVLAPTGVAALHVKGQTIHSFFKFRPRFMDLSSIKLVRDRKLYQKLQLLIIDEISMVRADIFDAIERFLCLNGPHPGEPFGGVQLCVVGDLFQLPPVVAYAEREIYHQQYRSAFFFSAMSYPLAKFNVVELKTVYRQHNAGFIELLNHVRSGKADADVLQALNQRRENHQLTKLEASGAIVLTTTNTLADKTNIMQLSKIPGEVFTYNASISGDFIDTDDKLPAPKELLLKVGAQVMFTRNDTRYGPHAARWVNGTIGIVTALSERMIEVSVSYKGYRKCYVVEKEEWENIRYHYTPETHLIEEQTVGTYCQYPLIHAWAITIHKSQGKTLEEVVIDMGNGAFAPGQLYVALSRCPDFDKITLKQPITAKDVCCDASVVQFYRSLS